MKSIPLLLLLMVALTIGQPFIDRDLRGFEPEKVQTGNEVFHLTYGHWKVTQPEDSDTSFEKYLAWLERQQNRRDAKDGLVEDDETIIVKRGNKCCFMGCRVPHSKDCGTVCMPC